MLLRDAVVAALVAPPIMPEDQELSEASDKEKMHAYTYSDDAAQ